MTTVARLDGPPPPPHAPTAARLEYLHAQLNSIRGDSTVSGGVAVLEQFMLLGPGERRQGGQAVVAFARGVHDGLGYALKFFLDRPSFLAERGMYHSRTLGSLLPQVQAEYDPEEVPHALTDSLGQPLPPCTVMERGESLPDWSKRAKPDVFQSVAVLAHVAMRLRDMHEGGYVHRDIKPGNIILLPQANRWTVIDFGCVASVGESAPLACTLVYAAPEVAAAIAADDQTVVVSPAVDAWAMGVVAFELLTGRPAFTLFLEGRDSVLGRLLGQEELPWEGEFAEKNPAARHRLGRFREAVLSLLHRDPAQRATLATFCSSVQTVFSSPAAGDT